MSELQEKGKEVDASESLKDPQGAPRIKLRSLGQAGTQVQKHESLHGGQLSPAPW